ncbi:MAG: tyrosine-type recombinase/integrase [Candidatus Baltobacteraceae bacterium]
MRARAESHLISDCQAYEIFVGQKQNSGITTGATPHSFATHMIENVSDIITIKGLLGYESLSTTQIYTNVSLEHMRSAYERAFYRARS